MDPRTDPRRALEVRRWHTWPHLKPQSVGEHSAQVLRILLAIWPDAPRHLMIHCVVHDIGEGTSGDPPYPIKAQNPLLKTECDRIERQAHLAMCLPWALPPPQVLSPAEKLVFKLAEFQDMFEWSLNEIALGNVYANLVADRCYVQVLAHIANKDLPPGVPTASMTYLNRRLKTTTWKPESNKSIDLGSKNGANGMKPGDRVIYTIDLRRGVAKEFLQDGDGFVQFDGYADLEMVKWKNLVPEIKL